ncbi:putative nuclease HARBI1 [Phlebotomus papatasi]|uniref:putative nuclease HARBI1 n=1 Tax=Phlebotomus papatasi TaxID=29031 RepID=UPI002483962F|nr:putative nuclease HARBI1 [Phlebotomus papatasi]
MDTAKGDENTHAEKCEDHFRTTHSRDDTGRYTVAIPFKDDPNKLGDSRKQALARLVSIEKKMSKDSSLKQEYTSFMDEYLSLGHMSKAPPGPGGCYQRPIGQDVAVCLSQTSVSRCVKEVGEAICNHLSHRFIRFPTTREDINFAKRIFYEKYSFPGVLGCIDCTHVCIKKPPVEVEHVYYAVRKASHTKNVQIICNADLLIFGVNARYGGSTHDSFIYNNSAISSHLKRLFLSGDRSSWLLADSGYGQQPWIMTPVSTPSNPQEERYNVVHKRARATVERCIGVLKSRFRCLSKQRVLLYSSQKAGMIITACCTLHNIMTRENYPLPEESEILDAVSNERNDAEHAPLRDEEIDATGSFLQQGRYIRQQLIRNNF